MHQLPEPDFEQLAERILSDPAHTLPPSARVRWIAEQLRKVWNARGAADIAKVAADLPTMMGPTAAGPYCSQSVLEAIAMNLDRALRSLDR